MRGLPHAREWGPIAAAIAVAVGQAAGCALQTAARAATTATTRTVVIDAVRFQPETVVVKAGDTVVWVNKDPFPHTVTSATGSFDSREIAAGKSWRYVAVKAGIFSYVCTLHPTMKATLKVD